MELGVGEIFVIGLLAVFLLKPGDMPRIARAMGKTVRSVRDFMNQNWADIETADKK